MYCTIGAELPASGVLAARWKTRRASVLMAKTYPSRRRRRELTRMNDRSFSVRSVHLATHARLGAGRRSPGHKHRRRVGHQYAPAIVGDCHEGEFFMAQALPRYP